MGTTRLMLGLAGVILSASVAQAVVIETVTVGNTGNGNATLSTSGGGVSVGAVNYQYQIGKYEVTGEQYTGFLNAVARTGDTYGLYNASFMPAFSGILRTTVGADYSYSVVASYADRPVNLVSWGSAARFANWMHNGQPDTGAQVAGTTETGSYNLNGATTAVALMAVTRDTAATWVLPNEAEWIKAGYHQNNGNTADYYAYATSSNSLPGQADNIPGFTTSTPTTDPGNTAHYSYFGSSGPRLTEVGEFENSESPYGTFDQNGNVVEWTEGSNGAGTMRSALGGAYNDSATPLGLNQQIFDPTSAGIDFGFRLVLIPEPSAMALLLAGSAMVLGRRKPQVD